MKKICILKRAENTQSENNLYIDAIKNCGANPILITEDNLFELKDCNGILITGGYNKGSLDDYLIGFAINNNLALLGICQGMQSMALYKTNFDLEDIENHYNTQHLININNSNLKKIIGKNQILVNSYHHQQTKISKIFKIVATSTDGVIEAIENPKHPFQIGVQWHPERMLKDINSQKIFKEFIKQAK